MPPKRSAAAKMPPPPPPTVSRANHVRNLWSEFEVWHAEQRAQLDQRIEQALRDLDTKWQKTATGNKKRKNNKKDPEHEKRRAETRKEIEKTFDGNKVREEWQKRLSKAGLNDLDWDDMSPNEQKKVETILGYGLEEEDGTVIDASPPAPPPAPVPATTQPTSHPSPPLAAPLTSESRSDSMSDTFAFVDRTTFSVSNIEDETPLDNWLEVRQRIKSDDEISLDASTTSSWGGGLEAPAYMGWFSESRSSAQSSQTSLSGSPERAATKLPAPEPFVPNLLSSAVTRLSSSTDRFWDSDKSDSLADSFHGDHISTNLSSSRGDRASTHSGKRKSQNRYIGPQLVDSDDHADEAEQFQDYKRMVRVQIIREFHQEAANADIDLFLSLEEANQTKFPSKDYISKRLEEHEDYMLQLRQRKEEERKKIVEAERQRRLAEWKQRQQAPPAPAPAARQAAPALQSEHEQSFKELGIDTSVLTERFLRELQFGPDGSSGAVSETPTVRSQLNRGSRPPNIQDWLAGATSESGTDTPTPTLRTSGWKDSVFGKAADPSALTDAPAFKRLPSGLSNGLTSADLDVASQSDSTALDTPVSKSKSSKKAQSSKTKVSEAPGKGVAEPASSKKKTTQPVVAQTEGASSSKIKLEQLPQPKAQSIWEQVNAEAPPKPSRTNSNTGSQQSQPLSSSKTLLPPPPVPLATRPDIPATFAAPSSVLSPSTSKSTTSLPLSTPLTTSVQLSAPSSILSPNTSKLTSLPLSTPITAPIQLSASTSGQGSSSKTAKAPQTTAYNPQPQAQAQTQPQPAAAAPDSRQRWIPPATETKRPQPSRMVTEPPSKLKKSQTLPQQDPVPTPTAPVPAPAPAQVLANMTAKRSRRMSDPVSPSPRSFDYPNGKVPGKAADVVPSSILKKPSTSTADAGSSSKAAKKSSGKGKKVTIEEIKDEQMAEEERTEHLPTDSRYIMEPKPVVAQAMFSNIFEFDEDTVKTQAKQKSTKPKGKEPVPSTSTSTSLAKAPSNQMWVPPPQPQAPVQKSVQFSQEEERHVRWTPNVAMLGEDSLEPGSTPEQDLFLSGLNSLQKLMEDNGLTSETDDQEFRELDRLLSEGRSGAKDSKKKVEKVEKKAERKSEKEKDKKEKVQSGIFWNPQGSLSGGLRMPGGL